MTEQERGKAWKAALEGPDVMEPGGAGVGDGNGRPSCVPPAAVNGDVGSRGSRDGVHARRQWRGIRDLEVLFINQHIEQLPGDLGGGHPDLGDVLLVLLASAINAQQLARGNREHLDGGSRPRHAVGERLRFLSLY